MSIYNLVNKYAMIEALHVAASNREWKPSAVDEFASTNGELFDATTRCHRSTGQSIEAFVADYEKSRPHVLVHQAASDMDAMSLQLTAFLGDNGVRKATDLAKLQKYLGTDNDEALKNAAAVFGISNPYDLSQRGTAPGNIGKMIGSKKAMAEADELEARAAALRKTADLAAPKKNGEDHSSNPWSAKNFNITKQGSLIRAIGVEKAARIAASVGCKIGDTKPNANY